MQLGGFVLKFNALEVQPNSNRNFFAVFGALPETNQLLDLEGILFRS